MRKERNAYANAIARVRDAHSADISSRTTSVECPKCGTKQQIEATPGKHTCIKCGYEFPMRT
jgi:ribosomal protein L37AE/L43A